MLNIKKILSLLICAIVLMTMLTACGTQTKNSMNYEQPVQALCGAMEALDTTAYLNCFTNAARENFTLSEDYNENFIQLLYPQTNGSLKIGVTITEHSELSSDEIDDLQSQYRSDYSKRISISKAEKLNVKIKVFQSNARRVAEVEMIVVKVEDSWYIFGDVLSEFDFQLQSTDSSEQDSSNE